MEATNPQAQAKLVSCHSSEMQGERIVKVEYGHPAHQQWNLLGQQFQNPYASLAYTMASGKVFVVTASAGEVSCHRSSVDAEPTVDILQRIEALEHEAARMRDDEPGRSRAASHRKALDSAVRSLQNARTMIERWLKKM